MLLIISLFLLASVSEISAENQRYVPEIAEEKLQNKPCTRRNDNPVAPIVSSIPNPIIIQNGNLDAPNEVFKSASLKNDINEAKNSEVGKKYPDHRHDDLVEQHIILHPANRNKNIYENPTPFIGNTVVNNEEDKIFKSILPKVTLRNDENDNIALNIKPESSTANKAKTYFEKVLSDVIYPKDSEKVIDDPKYSVQRDTKPFRFLQVASDKDSIECVSKSKNTDHVKYVSQTRRFFTDPSILKNMPRSRIPEYDEEEEEADEIGRSGFQNIENALLDPAKGAGITDLSSSPVNLLTHTRVCYACSTVTNPSCWQPDRRTTVKYCRQGHEVCVTKTFQTSNDWVLTRDCGNSCDDTEIPGPKYKSCSVCHTDMCNDAASGTPPINANNAAISVVLVLIVKYSM